jgi:hypothetical protein
MGGIKLALVQEITGWARKKIKAQRQAHKHYIKSVFLVIGGDSSFL